MARFRPEQPTFYQPLDADSIRDANPLLRSTEEFVEKHLDVEKFSVKLNNNTGGAPAIHPKLMMRILFYSFATGVRSYRDIEKHLQWDQNFMVLASSQKIDHSSICKFIRRCETEIIAFFTVMVYALKQRGLVTLGFVAIDGTKIKASGAKDNSGSLRDFKRRKEKLMRKIAELLHSLNDPDGPDDPEEKKRKEKKLKRFQQQDHKLDQLFQEMEDHPERLPREDEKINLTDRDARIMKDKDGYVLGYNVQLAVDENHLIVGCEITNQSADQKNFQPIIQATREQTGDTLQNSVIGTDGGYYSAANLLFCKQEGLNAFIPEGQQQDGSKKKSVAELKITVEQCELLDLEGWPVLVCPGNQQMRGILRHRSNREDHYRFSPEKKKCNECPLYKVCYEKKKRKYFELSKLSVIVRPERLEMKNKVASREGEIRRAQRFATNEHINGDIKEVMNLRRFYHRGKKKVRVILVMNVISQNLRRLTSLRIA